MRNELNLNKRLRALQLLVNGDPLVVRFKDQAGVDRVGSVDDLVKQDGDFVKVISGSSLKDVDRILAMTKRRAEDARNNQKAGCAGRTIE